MKYTKEIFEILSRGGCISENSVNSDQSRLYDAIEDDSLAYQEYYAGIGFLLEGGHGYYYFSRSEKKNDSINKVQKLAEWIDRVDFLKTFNSTFGPGFTFQKSNILERFSGDIELKEKARALYQNGKNDEEKINTLINELLHLGFIELENEQDGTYKVTSAFRYIEDLLDCLTINE